MKKTGVLDKWLTRFDRSFDRAARNPELMAMAASGLNILSNNRILFKSRPVPFRDSSSVRLLEAARKTFSRRKAGSSRRLLLLEATPHKVIYREGSLQLKLYDSWETPPRGQVVILPSLINRPYILDLGRGRSLIQYLVKSGFEVALFDWGNPTRHEQELGLKPLLQERLPRALKALEAFSAVHDRGQQPRTLLGHCLGGNLALLFAEQAPTAFDKLALLTTPIDTENDALLTTWFQTPNWDPQLFAKSVDFIPWTALQASFLMQRPTLTTRRWLQFFARMSEKDFRESWLQMEIWSNDSVSFPTQIFQDLLIPMYRENSMMRKSELSLPIFSLAALDDHIVPIESAQAIRKSHPNCDHHFFEAKGGHIGAVLSSKTRKEVWPELLNFMASSPNGGRAKSFDRNDSLPRANLSRKSSAKDGAI
ncbi:MAG: alpha/beta fold hydrolase [Bdellovibrionales bacterium]|nr:alpha/beta fold hydrolase [Bdellovibrionales bacterium]